MNQSQRGQQQSFKFQNRDDNRQDGKEEERWSVHFDHRVTENTMLPMCVSELLIFGSISRWVKPRPREEVRISGVTSQAANTVGDDVRWQGGVTRRLVNVFY